MTDLMKELEDEVNQQWEQTEAENEIYRENCNKRESLNKSQNIYSAQLMENLQSAMKSFDFSHFEKISEDGLVFILKNGKRGYLTRGGKYLWD
jgi:Skp family chaperone for outer membrane proteins